MFNRPMTVERLLAHSVIFEEAARQESGERIAAELRRLSDACVGAALAMISEAAEPLA